MFVFQVEGQEEPVEVEASDMLEAIQLLARWRPGVHVKKFIGQYEQGKEGTA